MTWASDYIAVKEDEAMVECPKLSNSTKVAQQAKNSAPQPMSILISGVCLCVDRRSALTVSLSSASLRSRFAALEAMAARACLLVGVRASVVRGGTAIGVSAVKLPPCVAVCVVVLCVSECAYMREIAMPPLSHGRKWCVSTALGSVLLAIWLSKSSIWAAG